jgi:hypothetical protein
MKVITVRRAVLDIWNDFNRPLEGRVPFMYLDVKGLVTTGLGNLIDSTGDAEQLAWQHADGTPASTDEIRPRLDVLRLVSHRPDSQGRTPTCGSTPPADPGDEPVGVDQPGFDVVSASYDDPKLGFEGSALMGPGSDAVRASLMGGQGGFNASFAFHTARHYTR